MANIPEMSRQELEAYAIELQGKIAAFEQENEEAMNKPITQEGFVAMRDDIADYLQLSYGEIKEKFNFEQHDEDEEGNEIELELSDEVIEEGDEDNINMAIDDLDTLPTEGFMSQKRREKLLRFLAEDVLENFEDLFRDRRNFATSRNAAESMLNDAGVVIGEIYE